MAYWFQIITNSAAVSAAEWSAPTMSSALVTVRNVAPVALDDASSTDEHTPITIAVLDNDRDDNGDTLSVSKVGQPTFGNAVISGTTTVVYTPANRTSDYVDLFTVTVCDAGGLCDSSVATVKVTANEHEHEITLTMGPDPFCPSWLMYYTLAFTNKDQTDITGIVITSPLPLWDYNGAWVDENSTLDGVLDQQAGLFIFQVDSVPPGGTVYARTILRSYSTFSGQADVNFYVNSYDLADTAVLTYTALASHAVCAPPPEPTPTDRPDATATPTAEPTMPPQGMALYLPMITM